MSFAGSAALVTGGAKGIGRAIVEQLRAQGCRVAVLDVEEGEDTFLCDVADEDAVVAAVAAAAGFLDGIDYAFLNAGIGGLAPVLRMTSAEWDRVHDVNLRGAFLCLREIAATMVAGGREGSIVLTGSISGFLADRSMSHYNSSKAGLAQLGRVAAAELGPQAVRVNVVAPGTTDTPLFSKTAAARGYHAALVRRTPLGRIGTSEDVAAAALALAGLRWVTGQVLVADGGVSLFSPIDIADFLPAQ